MTATLGRVSEHFDVIIVGSGAGGGTLAHTLAPSGKRILLLERGDFLPRETENWNPAAVFVDGRYISPDPWFDADGKQFQPQVHYYVGGATKLYGAALYRLRPGDFGEIQHADGLSPAWPVSYEDFEPWYTKAEWLYQVRGVHGEDPTEGHASKDYPWPPVSHEPRIQQISDALAAGGYHPFHAPVGILLNEANRPLSACVRCAWCDGYPCLVHAKSDADTIGVRPLLDQPNVTLLVNAEVERLETDPSGRTVSRVQVSRDGNQEFYEADIVVISAGAANSAKILLRSASDRHPAGLANGSDQVGRNYMFHNSKAIVAIDEERNDTVFQKTLGLNDFYFAGEGREWPLGNIQMLGKSNAMAMKGEEPKLTKLAPKFSLEEVATARGRHLADDRGPAHAGQPGHRRPRRAGAPRLPADERHRSRRPVPRSPDGAQPHRHRRPSRPRQELLHEHGRARGRRRPPGGYLPLRHGPGDVCARRQLQGARGRQPLRRRHELLPEHRGDEPCAYRHGQRDPRRRASAEPDGLSGPVTTMKRGHRA